MTNSKMSKAILLSLDDDPQVLRAISRDLRGRYRADFRIISTESANEALALLEIFISLANPVLFMSYTFIGGRFAGIRLALTVIYTVTLIFAGLCVAVLQACRYSSSRTNRLL